MKYKLSPEQAGITPHKVQIVTYNPNWPVMATGIAAKLKNALGENIFAIEHIGSTSVPDLAAKPIIDLIPIVPSITQLDEQKTLVEAIGYKWHGEFGIAGRRFCTYTNEAGERCIHLHFFEKDFPAIERHLAFRDYLIAHAGTAKEYEQEKKRAAQLHANDSLAYNDEKSAWVQHHEKQAVQWYRERRQEQRT